MDGLFRSIAGLLLVVLVPAAQARVELVGRTSIPGSATDRSGLSGRYTNAQGESIPANQLGSFGSGITYSGDGDLYYAANDRGFGDGTSASADRFHVFEIKADPKAKSVTVELRATRFLTDEHGAGFVGLSRPDPLRFDPEGIRVGRDGHLYVSDEYGPFVYEFSPQGRRVKVWNVPAKFAVANPNADEETEIQSNRSGRVTNKGMEGLAITPDGRALFGCMQSPLIQDGGRKGVNVRILRIDLADGATREYVYPLAGPKYAVSEILAVDDHRFLVLEREGKAGAEASFKKLFLVDVQNASDVSDTGTSPTNGLPEKALPLNVKAVSKRPFLDLLDPRFSLAGADFPAKVEGLTWGPDLADGRRLLLVTTDNDLRADQPSWIYAFAVDRTDLGPE
ncbi:MAG: esterase-like activity of phytase family protein [Isosphaeraceae bacterium]|nr:esterase-like activity of phytase family protein [Isosphaeraceae bacterium]